TFSGMPGRNTGTWLVPATRSNRYFLKVAGTANAAKAGGRNTLSITVHQNKNGMTPVAGTTAITGIPDFENMVDGFKNVSVPVEEHFFFIPEAKMLVVISRDRTKLLLNKVDLRG